MKGNLKILKSVSSYLESLWYDGDITDSEAFNSLLDQVQEYIKTEERNESE